MPWREAASIRFSSARPTMAVPFNVNWTSVGAGCATPARLMTASTATHFSSRDFLRKVFHHGQSRVWRRLPEAANRCVHHRLRQIGKQRLGRITRKGDQYLRRLLIVGAQTVLQRSQAAKANLWIQGLLARCARLKVAVALANKTARIAWAVMIRGECYRPVAAA